MSNQHLFRLARGLALASILWGSVAAATDNVEVMRRDDDNVIVRWQDSDPVDIFLADRPEPVAGERPVVAASRAGEAVVPLSAGQRRYIVIRDKGDDSLIVAGERLLPLQQGSNFRDIGGYAGADGKRVRWGRIYRSGAVPLLTDRDYQLLGGLGLDSIIDLRSLEEREVAPDTLDDRTGALFISNDYSIRPMMSNMASMQEGNMYSGLTQVVRPQFRAIFRRLLADDGAVMYHCSAGQDRTGVATALILSALGVDRRTILQDYHKSTEWRRPQWEMPTVDPEDYPDNMIVQYYMQARANGRTPQAEPLYTRDGQSHLAQFLDYVDREYGGVGAYLDRELGVKAQDIARLRTLYLE